MQKILLRAQNIKKSYGDYPVLKGISLDIYKGEIVSLLGVNGAGKTTLSSILATLHPATSGDIEYNGISIYEDVPGFRLKLGYCPQKPNLNSGLTLEQNLIFAGKFYGLTMLEIKARVKQIAEQLELQGYLHQKSGVLSGGYKQRFMLARSLLHKPEFVILDEPTVGLDPHVRRTLWEMIKNLKKEGITVLLTTHYLDEAEKLSDRVCILDKGLIRLVDTPDKLLADFKQKNLEDVFIELLKAGQDSLA
jgi:ABC-2 type transport system ATP-binding protein